jgi:hypothetical protein
MASIDSRFYLAFTFEKYFVDKETGAPLAAGRIEFFQDAQRTVPKDVYKLSGTPGNYTYTNLGSIVYLDAVGVPEDDSNNNIAIYFFPYDGDIETTTNTVELYYYRVFSVGEVEQFTREAQPNVFPSASSQTAEGNYIPNGQFYLHNNIPATIDNNNTAGQISAPITIVAPGGWTFERPSGSTATDIVTFSRIGSVTSTNPPDQARYVINIENQNPGAGDAIKDLRVKLGGVNKFASTTQQYTYVLYALNLGAGTIPVELILIKNYGTGGSPETETVLTTINVSASGSLYPIAFTFGTNAGKTLGTNDDDFLQLSARMPGDAVFEVQLGDEGLFPGVITNPVFAATTNRQTMFNTLFQDFNWPNPTSYAPEIPQGGFPDYDGNSYYLPLVYTPNGIAFDSSGIGDIVQESQLSLYDSTTGYHPNTNRIAPWGIQYKTSSYSPLGIPMARLQAQYWNTMFRLPQYGTGALYFTTTIPAADNNMLASNNSPGTATDASDGSGGAATGFTFTNVAVGSTTYYANAWMTDFTLTNEFTVENQERGIATAPGAGTSGFTVTEVRPQQSILANLFTVQCVDAATLANPGNPGKYFEWSTIHLAVVTDFYVWYQITNETDPAVGGRTGIKIVLAAVDTAPIVAQKTSLAINGWKETLIATVAASAMAAGDYFNIYSTAEYYVVWFMIDSVGTQPTVPGALYIPVSIASTDTAAQVAIKTQSAMNMQYFASPDYRGYFFRVWDNGAGRDPNANKRGSLVLGIQGDVIGTFQLDENQIHDHDYDFTGAGGSGIASGVDTGLSTTTVNTVQSGGFESRGLNISINAAIIY